MKTNKELTKQFIETYKLPEELSFLLEHYRKHENDIHTKDNDKNWNLMEDFITEYLIEDFEKQIDKKDIEKIENYYDYESFFDGNVDIYNEDLIKNIELFWDYIETFWNKDDFYNNLMNWQKIAYEKLLIDIKKSFVEFLKDNI